MDTPTIIRTQYGFLIGAGTYKDHSIGADNESRPWGVVTLQGEVTVLSEAPKFELQHLIRPRDTRLYCPSTGYGDIDSDKMTRLMKRIGYPNDYLKLSNDIFSCTDIVWTFDSDGQWDIRRMEEADYAAAGSYLEAIGV